MGVRAMELYRPLKFDLGEFSRIHPQLDKCFFRIHPKSANHFANFSERQLIFGSQRQRRSSR
jgi:hypothetical protein